MCPVVDAYIYLQERLNVESVEAGMALRFGIPTVSTAELFGNVTINLVEMKSARLLTLMKIQLKMNL